MAKVYCMQSREFNALEVLDLLKSIDTSKVSDRPAQKPKGSEVYVYVYGSTPMRGKLYAYFTRDRILSILYEERSIAYSNFRFPHLSVNKRRIYIIIFCNILFLDDWVADGYRWFNAGCDKLPRTNPQIYKRKFHTLLEDGTSAGFKRLAFCDLSVNPAYIVVQYVGDESIGMHIIKLSACGSVIIKVA